MRISELMNVNATRIRASATVRQAAEVLIRRLPVVADGKLVGTVSRADICRAVLGA